MHTDADRCDTGKMPVVRGHQILEMWPLHLGQRSAVKRISRGSALERDEMAQEYIDDGRYVGAERKSLRGCR